MCNQQYFEMGKNLLINEIIKMELELEFEYENVETKEEYYHSRKEYLLKQNIYDLVCNYSEVYELLYTEIKDN